MKAIATIREFARWQNIPESYVRRMVKTGKLPHTFSGNRCYINVPLALKALDDLSLANVNVTEAAVSGQ